MSVWVKVPGTVGDGEMSIAGPDGPVRLPVTDGVVRWPEGMGKPHSSLKPASPSARAVEAYRQEALGCLEAERRRLDEELSALTKEAEAPRETAPASSGPKPAPNAPSPRPYSGSGRGGKP